MFEQCAEATGFEEIVIKSGFLSKAGGGVAKACVFCFLFVFSMAQQKLVCSVFCLCFQWVRGRQNVESRSPEAHFRGFRGVLKASKAGFGGPLGVPIGFVRFMIRK